MLYSVIDIASDDSGATLVGNALYGVNLQKMFEIAERQDEIRKLAKTSFLIICKTVLSISILIKV